jgi:NAD(P)-dependent dehydrogenase (short-subunit alcohol dehydrogenase family)
MDRPRTVLVTGAAKRIGRVIALRLYEAGYRVAIHYSQSEKDARATAEECGSAPLFQADLEKVEEIKRMFLEVEQQLGSLYGLVNNAARVRNHRGRLGFHT